MDYSELAKGQHLTDAKDTIQLLMDEGYDFSEYSYDELLEAYMFSVYGIGENVSYEQQQINEGLGSILRLGSRAVRGALRNRGVRTAIGLGAADQYFTGGKGRRSLVRAAGDAHNIAREVGQNLPEYGVDNSSNNSSGSRSNNNPPNTPRTDRPDRDERGGSNSGNGTDSKTTAPASSPSPAPERPQSSSSSSSSSTSGRAKPSTPFKSTRLGNAVSGVTADSWKKANAQRNEGVTRSYSMRDAYREVLMNEKAAWNNPTTWKKL